VVGEAILREVIGADAVTAVARADKRASLLRPLLVEFLLLSLVQPAAEDAEGALVVLVLAPLVLTFDFQLFRGVLLVPQTDSALRLVDVLSVCGT
jgi:hypothetical protein